MANVPNSRPRMSTERLREIIKTLNIDLSQYPLFLVGVRGYYLNSMGEGNKNDRGIYDDAIFIVSPNAAVSFNANTDPSVVRKGKGTGAGKGMAKLKNGLWKAHQFGKHKTYEALIQTGGQVTVIRDGTPDYEDTGWFGINIHRGGYNTTSSEGCQTIHPSQWDSFYALVSSEAKRLYGNTQFRKVIVPYLLIENDGTLV
jgi:hypothetical protein